MSWGKIYESSWWGKPRNNKFGELYSDLVNIDPFLLRAGDRATLEEAFLQNKDTLKALEACELTKEWGPDLLADLNSELNGYWARTNRTRTNLLQYSIGGVGAATVEEELFKNDPFGSNDSYKITISDTSAHVYTAIVWEGAGGGGYGEESTRSIWIKGPAGKKTHVNSRYSALAANNLITFTGEWQRVITPTDLDTAAHSWEHLYYAIDNRNGGTLEAGDVVYAYRPQVETTYFATPALDTGNASSTTEPATFYDFSSPDSYLYKPETTGTSVKFKSEFNDASISDGFNFEVGETYLIQLRGEGNVRYRTGVSGSDGAINPITLPADIELTATSDTVRIQVYGPTSGEGEVTNITLRKLISQTA